MRYVLRYKLYDEYQYLTSRNIVLGIPKTSRYIDNAYRFNSEQEALDILPRCTIKFEVLAI